MIEAGESVTTVIEGHITVDDRGVARIQGTRIKVMHLIMNKMAYHWTPEQMQENYPHLSLAQVHAAMLYYYEHQPELDQQIKEDLKAADEAQAQAGESPIATRLRALGKLA